MRQGNDMGWAIMMRVMSSTPSPAAATPDWAHTYFWAFLYYFLELFGRLTISSRHKVKELNYYIILLCHGDTQRELVKHSLDPPCASFISCWVRYPLYGCFSPLWYFMVRLIHVLYVELISTIDYNISSFNLSHSFWKWLGFGYDWGSLIFI